MSLPLLIALIAGGVLLYAVFLIKFLMAPRQISQIRKMIDNGNTKGAIKACKVLLSKHESNVLAHWFLAEAYFKENRNELAVVEYKFVLRLNKFSGEATENRVRTRLAALYEKFGQLDEAQKEYLLLTKLEPENYRHFFKIGDIFYRKNYSDKALSYFEKTVKMNPTHGESHYYLGVILHRKGQVKEALSAFNQALHYSPQLFKVHYFLGLIQKTLGVFDKARSEFNQAQRDPDFKLRALLEIGKILLQMDNVREAIVELERALSFAKTEDDISIDCHYVLAQCYEKSRNLPGAIEQWEIIDGYRKGYKDISQKLGLYSDLRTDDRLKDFLTASKNVFIDITKKLLTSMNYSVLEIMPVNDDAVTFLASEMEGKWRNTKRSTRIIMVRRDSKLVGELTVREILEQMKTQAAARGMIISSTGFAPSAQEYALTRPIDLVDKSQLTQYLKEI